MFATVWGDNDESEWKSFHTFTFREGTCATALDLCRHYSISLAVLLLMRRLPRLLRRRSVSAKAHQPQQVQQAHVESMDVSRKREWNQVRVPGASYWLILPMKTVQAPSSIVA
jgi:hypothetical protein